ncbi:MAG TPA: DUF4064 domain-containing protein, partial [Candidatus Bathyarchaeia archaeon]
HLHWSLFDYRWHSGLESNKVTAKKTLNKIRGWFPQEPTIPKSSTKMGYQPLPREPWVSRNRLALGLIGGVLTVLIGLVTIFGGLIFSGVLRSYNIYATGEQNPQLIAIQDFILGGVGLAAGIIGIIGSRKANHRGGIMLIIAGATSLSFPLWGILPAALMLLSGITEIRKKPLEAQKEPGKFVLFITGLWKFEKVAAFSMNLAVLSFFTFLFSQLYNESQDSMELLWFFYPLLFIYPLMRKKDALKSIFSKIFFASAFILIVLTGIFFGFHILTSTGFVSISLVTIPIFTLLYAWVENFPKQTLSHSYQAKNTNKIISTIFVLAGIILLVFSLAFTSHIEQKLGPVRHNEIILRQDFNLTQQIPDTTLSVNLTTQDRLAFGIFPADYFSPHSRGYSSVDFSISYQSALGEPFAKVYEYDNISSNNRDPIGSWSVTQNGTYILNLHYNYNETIHVNENIGRYWSTIEPVPTTVYTPLLADYVAPTLIISLALLTVSVAIPIQLFLKEKSMKNEHYNEFTIPPPPPPPEMTS